MRRAEAILLERALARLNCVTRGTTLGVIDLRCTRFGRWAHVIDHDATSAANYLIGNGVTRVGINGERSACGHRRIPRDRLNAGAARYAIRVARLDGIGQTFGDSAGSDIPSCVASDDKVACSVEVKSCNATISADRSAVTRQGIYLRNQCSAIRRAVPRGAEIVAGIV